ncbi:MAG: alpha/beta hydrolase [Rhodospirillaceae bacterium]|nr:alpha/beta hydrolase [Rhodospirillaceae bacterium]|tara:strand:- start:12611 stop:13249 length:639 start_codon:yes stop_codon:yes gene_type:complete
MPETLIPGPAGHLEARFQLSKAAAAPLVTVLHPHPLHGGAMNNKVTYTVFKAFAGLGFSALRFNFRGVGRSDGSYGEGDGETDDAIAAMNWFESQHDDHGDVWLAGFSFGAWITARTFMARPGIAGFVLIAPGAIKYDWSFFDPCPCDGLIIQGSVDGIVAPDTVEALAGQLNQQGCSVAFEMIEGAGHFFENDIELLQQTIADYVSDRIAD